MSTTSDSLIAKQAASITHAAATQPAVDPVDAAIPEPMVPVPVRAESPAQSVVRSVSLSANRAFLLLLPQDPRRRRAVVWAATASVWLCSSLEQAQAAAGQTAGEYGALLPAGLPGIVITAKSAFWVAWTSTAASVSVVVEKDDE